MSRTTPVIALVVLLALATLWWATPRPPRLSEHASGDAALAGQLRDLADARGHQSLAATVITPESITHAAIGESAPGSGSPIGPDHPIELGSITKSFDGFLLADAIERGEVGADDTLATHLPELAGTPIGAVTLTELASHRAGVPPLPPSVILPGVGYAFTGRNPYAKATRESVLAEVRGLPLMNTRGEVAYSNLGATLLGWALANAAGAPDWETHVTDRLLTPLGIEAAFAATPEDIPPGTVPGYTDNGFAPEPWTSPAFRPAGSSTFITSAAVGTYARAILNGQVPGSTAMDPRFDAGEGTRIGLAWFTTDHGGRAITWHNGGTAGFRTMLAIDREAERAVLVVGNTSRSVDDLALSLLTSTEIRSPGAPLWATLLLPSALVVLVGGALWSAVRGRDRAALIAGLSGAVFGLALTRVLGSWAILGAWVWVAATILTAVASVLSARRWPTVPWHPTRLRALRWVNAGFSVALAIAAVALIRI